MALASALVLALAGYGGRGDGTTALRLSGFNSWVGRATFTLRCNPPGGDITAPARACSALEHHADVLFRPRAFLCRGGPWSWWNRTLTGRFNGRPVHTKVSTCWTAQMELIGRLGIADQLQRHVIPHSKPRRHLARAHAIVARQACLRFWNTTPDRSRRQTARRGAPYRRASLDAHATVEHGRMTLRGCNFSFYGSRNLRVSASAGERAGQLVWGASLPPVGSIMQAAAEPIVLRVDGRIRAAGATGQIVGWRRRAAAARPPVPLALSGRYPVACLRSRHRVSDTGTIAAASADSVELGALDGRPRRLEAMAASDAVFPAVGWSVDGRFLGTSDGRLWSAGGRSLGRLFSRLTGPWSWSPAGDCALGFSGGVEGSSASKRLSVAEPGHRPHPFLRGAIQTLAFTPDGRRLVVVVSSGTTPRQRIAFYRVDLAAGTVHRLAALPPGICCVSLGRITPDGRTLLFWAGPGSSVMQDGWTISRLDLLRGGTPRLFNASRGPARSLPSARSVVPCGRRLLAALGGPRPYPTIENERLAYLYPRRAARLLTPRRYAYLAPACSPQGGRIAAVRTPNGASSAKSRLALLSASGRFLRLLSRGGAGDGSPDWGGAGIVFSRALAASGRTRLWWSPHGGPARPTSFLAAQLAWDWSATPPLGLIGS